MGGQGKGGARAAFLPPAQSRRPPPGAGGPTITEKIKARKAAGGAESLDEFKARVRKQQEEQHAVENHDVLMSAQHREMLDRERDARLRRDAAFDDKREKAEKKRKASSSDSDSDGDSSSSSGRKKHHKRRHKHDKEKKSKHKHSAHRLYASHPTGPAVVLTHASLALACTMPAEHHRHKHKHEKEKRFHKHKRHRGSPSDSDADDMPKKASEPIKLSDFLAQQSDGSD